MADMNELNNIIRKGIVQSVNAGSMRARVKFGDKGGIISGDLFILISQGRIVPSRGEKGGDKVQTADGHTHEAYVAPWIPEVGSMVLCLMMPDGDGEGYILGGVQ